MVEPREVVGSNIRALRKARGMTQEGLASGADMDSAEIGRVERGKREPGVRTLLRIARGLDVEVGELLRGLD